MRFVIGRSPDPAADAALAAEEEEHGDMLRLDLVEGYAGLPAKTLAFLRVGGWQGDSAWLRGGGGYHLCRGKAGERRWGRGGAQW